MDCIVRYTFVTFSMNDTPTEIFYGLFQYLFDEYNQLLFDGSLTDCLIVITRKKNVMGHYSHKRWLDEDENKTDELALNPNMFHRYELTEICQTFVHEMCHGWQYHYGTPSRGGYHNKEWAEKMISVGLMPSSNGQVGGKTTGQKMSDYPIPGSKFDLFTKEVLNNKVFAQLYYEINPTLMASIDPLKPFLPQIKGLSLIQDNQTTGKKTKIKYSCACSNVWGKPDLELYCKICEEDLLPAD